VPRWLRPTPGVLRSHHRYRSDALGLEFVDDGGRGRELILSTGLASGPFTGHLLLDHVGPVSRAARLRSGVVRAACHAAGHFIGTGWSHWLLLGVVLAIASAVHNVAVAALALASGAVLLSFVVHELGHVLAYRVLAGEDAPAHLVARGLSFHLVRRRLPPTRDVAVIVSGPGAPAALSIVLAPALLPVSPVTWWVTAALGAGHLLALLLPAGDGRTLRDAVRAGH
jgi:hypothetical protein